MTIYGFLALFSALLIIFQTFEVYYLVDMSGFGAFCVCGEDSGCQWRPSDFSSSLTPQSAPLAPGGAPPT